MIELWNNLFGFQFCALDIDYKLTSINVYILVKLCTYILKMCLRVQEYEINNPLKELS